MTITIENNGMVGALHHRHDVPCAACEIEKLQAENERLRTKLDRYERRSESGENLADAIDLAEDNEKLRQQLATAQNDAKALREDVDKACNALTDSICVSGNDAETNLYWVRKLRAALKKTPNPTGEG